MATTIQAHTAQSVGRQPGELPAQSPTSQSFATSSNDMATLPQDGVIPSEAMLRAAADLPVYDRQGKSHSFHTLYAAPGERHLIIFVRHFFCGMCQDFLTALSAGISPSDLSKQSPPTTLTIIGCGDPSLIDDYCKNSKCSPDIPIYADPSRKLYDAFNLISNLSAVGKRPEYQTSGLLSLVSRSIVQGVRAGSGAFKGGDYSQIGGEFLFQDGKVTWCHRMANTRDHTDIPALKKILGV